MIYAGSVKPHTPYLVNKHYKYKLFATLTCTYAYPSTSKTSEPRFKNKTS